MKTRRRFTAELKAKVALEAMQGHRTVAELAKRHELHPNLIAQWKRQAIEKLCHTTFNLGLIDSWCKGGRVGLPMIR